MNPIISIVVPIYNISLYLEKCIDSLISQSSDRFEIILVNDGSTDNCSSICEKYKEHDGRITVIHKANGGLVSARKEGARIAKGKYIACVDGDDFVSDDFVISMLKVIDEFRPDIVCCGYYQFHENTSVEKKIKFGNGLMSKGEIEKTVFPILLESAYGESLPTNIWAKCFKRELYLSEQDSVDNKITMGEDSACVSPCFSKADSIYIIDKCLYYYRYNPNSITKCRKPLDVNGPKLRFYHYEKRLNLDKADFQEQLYRCTVHSLFNVIVSQFWGESSYNDTCKKISLILSDPIYKQCIKRCKYKSLRNNVSLLAMRLRLYPIIMAYANVIDKRGKRE